MLYWRVAELREALRRAILKAFVRWGKLSPEAADTLVGWDIERCGFSLFVGPPVADRERLGGLLPPRLSLSTTRATAAEVPFESA
jgi:hypothetical protein